MSLNQKNFEKELDLPCMKYIVRNITTQTDMLHYESYFFSFLKKNGLSSEDAFLKIKASLFYIFDERCIKKHDYIAHSCISGEEYERELQKTCRDMNLKKYAECRSFYRGFENKNKICCMCPLYIKNNNINEDVEYKILKYMLSGIDAFDAVTGCLDESSFQSVLDIAGNIKTQTPCLIQGAKILYSSLCSNIYEIFHTPENELHGLLALYFRENIRKNKKIHPLIMERESWETFVFDLVYARIREKELISDEEAERIMTSLQVHNVSVPSRPKHTKKKEKTLEDIPDINDSWIIADKELPENIQTTLPSSVSTPSRYLPQIYIPRRHGRPENSDSESFYDSSSTVLGTEESYREITIPEEEAPGNLIPEYELSIDELSSFTLLSKNKKTLVLSEAGCNVDRKKIYIECATCEDGTYVFLVYFPKYHSVCYAKSDISDSMDFISPYLCSSSYEKVCYTPYLLYGACKVLGIKIRNVYSILSAHLQLMNGTNIVSYESVLSFWEPNVFLNCSEECFYANGFPLYRGARRNLEINTKNDAFKKMIDNQFVFDEVLGRSFVKDYCNNGILFSIDKPGSYVFSPIRKDSLTKHGVFLSYFYSSKPSGCDDITKSVLSEICRKGFFRQFSLYLSVIKENGFSLFLEDTEYEYVDDMTLRTVLKMIKKNKRKDEEIRVEHHANLV